MRVQWWRFEGAAVGTQGAMAGVWGAVMGMLGCSDGGLKVQWWGFGSAMLGVQGCSDGDLRVLWGGFGGALMAIRGAAVVLLVLSPQNTLSLPVRLCWVITQGPSLWDRWGHGTPMAAAGPHVTLFAPRPRLIPFPLLHELRVLFGVGNQREALTGCSGGDLGIHAPTPASPS